MTGGFPDWQPFSLAPEASSPLELSGMKGPALVLLAAPAVDEGGWAVRAAARIARQRASRNGRLLLADLDLRQPRLHTQVGADNGEGMSDLLVWGASPGRVSQPVDAGFRFVPAGTPVADPGRVLASPRWEALLEGFEEAGVELFLYLPWDAPGRDAVLGRARNVVLLAARPELDRLERPDVDGLRIGAVLGPDDDPTAPESPVDEPEGAAGEAAAGGDDAAEPAREVPAPATGPSGAPAAAAPSPDDVPDSDLRVESGGIGRARVFTLVLLVLVLAAVVYAAFVMTR